MITSLVALFLSLGGVGYAATQLPNNSVGPAQLKSNAVTNSKISNSAVTYKKIEPGTVGTVRANLNQLQARVVGTCGSGAGIGAVDSAGKVTCNSSLPQEFGTTANVVVAAAATPVNSLNLPAGAQYLALANPNASVTVTGPHELVKVTCSLTVGANTQTRLATVDSGDTGTTTNVSIPLQVAGPAGTATVACSGSSTGPNNPTVTVNSGINAIQTSSNS